MRSRTLHQHMKYEPTLLPRATCVETHYRNIKYEQMLSKWASQAARLHKKRGTGGVPQFNYLSLSHISNSFVDESYCKGALHNESLNLFWFAVTSTDKVTLLGVNTNTKSPTFCGLPSRA